ncbi:MAG TPA: DUF5926 family protein [Kineosporiaceae bacterium]|nr:DUF5926 family protein [Kineosporiaceae bacterium]
MGKKQRRNVALADRPSPATALTAAEVPVVPGREPCPCGSGKRYKACHGRFARDEAVRLVTRPFQGLPGECDWVAMREIVPAATATVKIAAEFGGGEVTVATVLPLAWPALHRADGTVLIGLQTSGSSGGDASRSLADALLTAREIEPGSPVPVGGLPGPGPRLQDVLDPSSGFEVTVHEGFEFWFPGTDELTPEVRDSLEQANNSAIPTKRLTSVPAAYWCQIGVRRHLRWVLPDDETEVLDGLSRLHAAGNSALMPGTRYVGSFRANGLIVPVWDLAADTEAEALESPITEFDQRLRAAMAVTTPLTADERRAKAGVVNRQLTLR